MILRNKRQRSFDIRNQYAMTLNGSQFIDLKNPASFRFERTSPFSISGWFKFTNADGLMNIMVAKKGATADLRGYSLYKSTSNNIFFELRSTSINAILGRGNTQLLANTWYYIQLSYDGSSLISGCKLFINNTLESITMVSDNLTTTILNTSSLFIGKDDVATGLMNGSVDEVVIHNTNLTQIDSKELYNNRRPRNIKSTSKFSNVVANYSMGDATATHDGTDWQIPDFRTGMENKKSFVFDGVSERIEVPTVAFGALDSVNITWAAWIKVGAAEDASGGVIINKGQSTTDGNHFGFYVGNSTGALTNELLSIANNSANARIGYITTNRLELFDDQWHHVAITANGSVYKIYLDGISKPLTIGQGSNNGSTFVGSNNRFSIGAFFGASTAAFLSGRLADIRIYTSAMSDAEMLSLYNFGSPIESNLVAHWRFGNNGLDTNTFLKDVKGTNNGTPILMEALNIVNDSPHLGTSSGMGANTLVAGVLGGN